MKKLLLIIALFTSFSCMKNDKEQVQTFVSFGEVVRNNSTTLEFKTDLAQDVIFNLSTPLINVMSGDRLLVMGGMKSNAENTYVAELYQIAEVDIEAVIDREDVMDESELGEDGVNISQILASGDYLNLFFQSKNHSVTLVIDEVKEDNGTLRVKSTLYNKKVEEETQITITSFDISEYLLNKSISIDIKYKDLGDKVVTKNIVISND